MNAGMETTADTRESILVVEDDRAVMSYVAQTLRGAGFRVLTAGNGVEALDVLETENLILTDIAMPRMNGYQLYEQVVESPQWIAIPFIFLTARALDSDIRFAKELGVDEAFRFLKKKN